MERMKQTRIYYFLGGDGMALRLLDFGLEIGDGLWAIDVDLWSVSGGNGEKGGIYLKDLLLGGLYGNLHGGGE